jgi:hypothetical protein
MILAAITLRMAVPFAIQAPDLPVRLTLYIVQVRGRLADVKMVKDGV